MTEPLDFSGNVEDWEDRVFRVATLFTVFRRHAGRQKKSFHTFPEAIEDAADDDRALVYAVTEAGRSIVLIRPRWKHFQRLWDQRAKA